MVIADLSTSLAALDPGHVAGHIEERTRINLLTARMQEGEGSPEGVITASPGSLYRDITQANGALLWFKNSGTGNTDWKVLQGDTGRRLVRSWTSEGVVTGDAFPTNWGPRASNAGVLMIRRIGVTVTVIGTNVATTGSVSNVQRLYTAPDGFKHSTYYQDRSCNLIPWFTSAPAYKAFGLRDNLARGDNFSSAAGDFSPMFKVTYTTEDAWPTSLPGSAV